MQWIFDRVPARFLLALVGTALLLPFGLLPEPKPPRRAKPPVVRYLGEEPSPAKTPINPGARSGG